MGWVVLQNQAAKHIQHAVHCAGRFPCAVGQRRKRMIRPIQVRRAIDEYKWVFWDLNHNVRAFYEFMDKGCHRRMKTSGFSALYRKDFAIGKIARKTKLWISLCIFLIQVNNSFIKVILKTYLSNKIKALL